MAITADEVVVKLKAELADYDRKITSSTRMTEAAFQRIEKSSDAMAAALRKNTGAMAISIKGFAGSLATYFTGRELTGLLDSFTRLQNNLRVAGVEGDALKQVQDRLFQSAQRYGVGIEGLSSLFSTLTQASKELGASQEQVFGLTDAVSASLKITGLSAEQAEGALLQLGQALRGGKIQAEEYNSLLDGLYPLLEAAANGSSRFGGSVAKLTAQVKDGKVSSQEFFNAILAGSDVLENKAAKASLTLSAGFTTLNNALTVYFGEADKANGVSAAIGDALGKVANNLDSLIPAIAIVATALGVNFVVSAVNAANATAALSGGLTVLQRLPVVAAITAIAAAIAYVGTESARTEARLANLNSNFDALAKKVDGATSRAIAAGQNISIVGNASVTAAGKVDQLGRAFQSAAGQAATLAAQAKIATLAMIGTERTKTRNELARLEGQQQTSGIVGKTFGIAFAPIDYISGERSRRAARQQRRQGQIDQLRSRLGDLDRLENQAVQVDPRNFVEPNKPAPAPAAGGKAKKPKAASGPTPDEITEQYSRDLRQIVARDLQARLAVAVNADDRAELEHRLLNDEIRTAEEEIASNSRYNDTRKAKLLSELKSYEAAERSRIEQERQDRLAKDALDIQQNGLRNQQDLLRSQADLTDDRDERRALEMRLLDLAYQQEEAELQAVIASETATDAQKKIAEERLKILGQIKANKAAEIEEQNTGPLGQYLKRTDVSGSKGKYRVEELITQELDYVQDSISGAITKRLGVKDPFLSGIIDLFIQQNIMRPIAEAMSAAGGGGIGGIIGGIGSILGFSSGGYTGNGPRNQVAGVVHRGEYVVPADAVSRLGVSNLEAMSKGKALSVERALGPLNHAVAAPRPQQVTVVVQANDYFDAKVERIVGPIAAKVAHPIAQAHSARAASAMGQALNRGMPARLAQYQRDGT
ncbi:putative phage tape measure protein [Sphingomonas paucimobilis]|nr:putative phage tape measure protein [Sphingomonas paucimobilis]